MRTNVFNDFIRPAETPLTNYEISSLKYHWKGIMASGILFVLLGLFSLYVPNVSIVSLTLTLASLLIVVALIHLVQAYEFRHQRGSTIRFFQAMLAIVVASLLFQYPRGGMEGLTLALSFYFLVGSAMKWVFFTEMRAHGGWNWGLVSAVTSYALGLVAVFPFREVLPPGTLLGIEFLITGSGMIGFALSVHKFHGLSFHDDIHHDQGAFTPHKSRIYMRR